ncbi:hypothetical protein F7R01_12940 [Pseudomonas argentinensis]|uniref:Uncharacterized protein n=1 Tax=Phytopseudomonas argentinensis TaxID=289370 RepID=A0A1I3HI99_9GAMM|nr:hypothetical protein [Pseudomonas argentinensis]KAB0548374.1 hypothetical protein F7R01_12940 [Pseudomonas argentinensis]SFI35363.1 hypothetical protein SAMN05216602_0925 [Pseudomonas argentinensis]
MKEPIFLIDYLCDNQPMHLEVTADTETMSVEQAQQHVQNAGAKGRITDVQVSKITRTHEPGTTPGHQRQP